MNKSFSYVTYKLNEKSVNKIFTNVTGYSEYITGQLRVVPGMQELLSIRKISQCNLPH